MLFLGVDMNMSLPKTALAQQETDLKEDPCSVVQDGVPLLFTSFLYGCSFAHLAADASLSVRQKLSARHTLFTLSHFISSKENLCVFVCVPASQEWPVSC